MKRIVYGEVLAPDAVDAQGDRVRAGEIEDAAHRFLARGGVVGAMHAPAPGVGRVVESFVARENDPDFTPGAWVLGVQLSEQAWQSVRSGAWTGFSIGGRATRRPVRGEDQNDGDGLERGGDHGA